jgi:hypothetical protein
VEIDADIRITLSVLCDGVGNCWKFNQEVNVAGIFCDLSKAFDCENEILLANLHFMAFKEQFQTGTDHTSQKQNKKKKKNCNKTIHCNSVFYSDWGTIKHGVPQRLNLGPLILCLSLSLFIYVY